MAARSTALLCGCLALAGCYDESTGPVARRQLFVTWVEWPAAVTAAAPGLARVIGQRADCGVLRLGVTAAYPRISIDSEEAPFNSACPLMRALAIPIQLPYDTLLPLPVLAVPGGGLGSFAVTATIPDFQFGDRLTRTLGFIELSAATDTTRVVGGLAVLTADSAGCAWARPEFASFDLPPYVVLNPPALGGAASRWAVVGGRFAPVSPARCGQDRALTLDYAEVTALP